MSRDILEQIVSRAIGDAGFRRRLQMNPRSALAEFKLTAEELQALTSRDPARLSALGVDQRMSRMFMIADDVSQSASRMDAGDASYAAHTEIDTGGAGAVEAHADLGAQTSLEMQSATGADQFAILSDTGAAPGAVGAHDVLPGAGGLGAEIDPGASGEQVETVADVGRWTHEERDVSDSGSHVDTSVDTGAPDSVDTDISPETAI